MRKQHQYLLRSAMALMALAPVAQAQGGKKPPPQAVSPATGTLGRIRASGQLKLGYRTDARPFSFKDQGGQPAGYSVDLCNVIADRLKQESSGTLTVQWVPVDAETRFDAVKQGQVDILCGADTETLSRRADVAFSIPIFPGGIGVVVRSDAATRLKDALSGQKLAAQPNWRANAAQALQTRKFAVVTGTTAGTWLQGKLTEFQLSSKAVPVDGYDAGVEAVLARKADAFFGDRAILLDAVTRSQGAAKLAVLDRQFTTEPLAFAFARGDEDFRLLVDRTLSTLYRAPTIRASYAKWFGAPSPSVLSFFQWVAIPE